MYWSKTQAYSMTSNFTPDNTNRNKCARPQKVTYWNFQNSYIQNSPKQDKKLQCPTTKWKNWLFTEWNSKQETSPN